MKWVSHQIVTGVAVFAATDDMLLTAAAMAGAIFPDKVEGNPRAGSCWLWRSRHRGWSHWPLLYVALIGLFARVAEIAQVPPAPLADAVRIGTFFCVGALLHILEDALCGKVPFLTPAQKVGIRLFRVGSVMEYVVAGALVLIAYGVRRILFSG